MRILLWDLGTPRNEFNEPLGICSVGAMVSDVNPFCDISYHWNMTGKEPPALHDFDSIGLSVGHGRLSEFHKTMTLLNEQNPNAFIVAGGPIPTFAFPELLKLYPSLICIVGEGETAYSSLITSRISHHSPETRPQFVDGIRNLAFRRGNDIIQTAHCSEQLDLLAQPARPFVLDVLRMGGIVRIEASRGCRFSTCRFCAVVPKYGCAGWRPFPIDSVIRQLLELNALGATSIYFSDEDFFGGDYQRIEKMCRRIIDLKVLGHLKSNLNFFVSACVDDVVEPTATNALDLMREAGFREVFLGIESGSPSQLQRYSKPATVDCNSIAINTLRTRGFEIDIGYILFDPELTFNELRESFQYLVKIGLPETDAKSIKALRVQPRTVLAEEFSSHPNVSDKLDIDTLQYPYSFCDSEVSRAFKLFSEYEDPLAEFVYSIQAASRGEVKSELSRKLFRKVLHIVRACECAAFTEIVNALMNDATLDPDFGTKYYNMSIETARHLARWYPEETIGDPAFDRALQSLRVPHETVGNRCIRAAFGLFIGGSRVLLIRRRSDSYLGGMWELPGGKYELNESPQECITREIREELQTSCTVDEYLCSTSFNYSVGNTILDFYQATLQNSEFVLADHDRYEWIEPEDLDRLAIVPADRVVLDVLRFTEIFQS